MIGACVISFDPRSQVCGWHPTHGCTRADCDLRASHGAKPGGEPLPARACLAPSMLVPVHNAVVSAEGARNHVC